MYRFYLPSLSGWILGFLFVLSTNIYGQLGLHPKVDINLQDRLSSNDTPEFFPIIVSLKQQLDTRRMRAQFQQLRSDKAHRVQTVVDQLQEQAARTQPEVIRQIRAFGGFQPGSIQQLWIANGFCLKANAELINYLANHPEVRFIEWDAPIRLTKAENASFLLEPGIAEPALKALNAHKLWKMGYTGYGTKVLIIDSGVDFMHPALRSQALYNTESLNVSTSGTIMGDFSDEHGTAVAGAILGLDRATLDTLGPAFNSLYIDGPSSNLINSDGEFEGSVRTAYSNLQWALNPDGNNFTSSDVPDVINNSWGLSDNSSQFNCTNSIYRDIIGSLNAAGVSVLFAAGNDGPANGTINFPGALAINEYVPLSIGSTDNNSSISNFSGRGPSICGNAQEAIKPEVVAPGQQIRTTTLYGRYGRISGTSFSTPYVTGVILLLKEAFPYLDGEKLQEAVIESAFDLGALGDDNNYGNGRVDALAAFNYLVAQGNTPVNPALSNNDVVLVEAKANNQDCGSQTNLNLTVANDGSVPILTFTVAIRQGNTGDLINSITWNGNIMPGEVTTIEPGSIPVFLGNYPIQVTLENPNGSIDRRALNNSLKLDVNITNDPILPVIDPLQATTCEGGQVTFRANDNEPGTVLWYGQPTSGSPLAEGNSFQTPALNSTTTFYASLQFSDRVGLANREVGTNTFLTPEAGLEFDAHAPFNLNSVKVYAEAPGPRIVVLREPDGQTQQRIINITQTGEQRIDLNFNVEPAEGYELVVTVGNGLSITTTNVNYPRRLDNVVTIRKAVGTVSTFYPFFYDWDITYEYACGRVPVTVAVEEGIAPVVNFNFSQSNGNGPEVNFEDQSTGAISWQWRFGDGGESTESNPDYSYNNPGTYLVELIVTGSDGCTSTLTREITVEMTTSTTEKNKLSQSINIQPNPVSDLAWVIYHLEERLPLEFLLTDVTGRILYQRDMGMQKNGQTVLDLSSYPPGLYFLITHAGSLRVGKKIVKID